MLTFSVHVIINEEVVILAGFVIPLIHLMRKDFLSRLWTTNALIICGKRLYDAQLRKRPLCHMQTANVQTCVRTCAVWYGYSLTVDIYCSIHSSCWRTTKAQISLRECAGWSGPSLSANCMRVISCVAPRMLTTDHIWTTMALLICGKRLFADNGSYVDNKGPPDHMRKTIICWQRITCGQQWSSWLYAESGYMLTTDHTWTTKVLLIICGKRLNADNGSYEENNGPGHMRKTIICWQRIICGQQRSSWSHAENDYMLPTDHMWTTKVLLITCGKRLYADNGSYLDNEGPAYMRNTIICDNGSYLDIKGPDYMRKAIICWQRIICGQQTPNMQTPKFP